MIRITGSRWIVVTCVALFAVLFQVETQAQADLPTASEDTVLRLYVDETDRLAIGEALIELAPPKSTGDREIKPIWQMQLESPGNRTLHPLYPVYLDATVNGRPAIRCLFRIPKNGFGSKADSQVAEPALKVILNDKNRAYPRRSGPKAAHSLPVRRLKVVRDRAAIKLAESEWLEAFRRVLENEIAQNEDHEIEMLLYLRWFGKQPKVQTQNWKRSPLAQFIFSISGMNDIRDALPSNFAESSGDQAYTLPPPKPIFLPQVPSQQTELPENVSPLANWAPRSCYYVEWPGSETMLATIRYVSREFDTWSPGTYPKPAAELLEHHLNRLGLGISFFQDNKDKIASVVLCGWDPYFQSGTNIMLLLQLRESVLVPAEVPYHFQSQNVLLLSTGQKLLRMAEIAHEKKKSLRQVSGFRSVRNRIQPQDGEAEKCFIYLSDYFFTNFISPRWWIHTQRRQQLNARLRLVILLQKIYQSEVGSPEKPTLEALKTSNFMPPQIARWLFKDLKETVDPGHIHTEESRLYDHPPIDTLPFDAVSKHEHDAYAAFKGHYIGRWQQMDPVGFQIVRFDAGQWKSRLFISPISNRSDFRQMSEFVAKQKIKHRHPLIDGQSLRLSLAINTNILRGFLPGIELPVSLQVEATTFDFAARSLTPNYWLDSGRRQDTMSYFRTPAALILPDGLIERLSPMLGVLRRTPSPYEGIEAIIGLTDFTAHFPLLITKLPVQGLTAVGLDPTTLRRLRNEGPATVFEDPVPSDLAFKADFTNGYMMKRKLLQEALKNRAIASWRRRNRFTRAGRLLGLNADPKALPLWIGEMHQQNVFSTEDDNLKNIVDRLPMLHGQATPHRWHSSVFKSFDYLPESLLAIQGFSSFISVEQNALFFESHYQFPPIPGKAADLGSDSHSTGTEESQAPGLDFDG